MKTAIATQRTSAAAPITLTSAAATPAAGDWHGLVVRHGTVTLRQVRQQFGGTGLSVLGGGDYVFENLACNDNAGDGVRLNFQGSYEFTGLEASRNGGAGFLNDSPNATVTISQGVFRDNGGNGLYVAGNSILTGVLIERSQGSYGVFGGGGGSQSSHTWTDLTVSDSKGHGALLSGFQNLTLVRGHFLRSGNDGLYAQVGGRVRAEDSQFNSNGGAGLSCWQVSEAEVIGGTARFNADTGLASTGGLKVTGVTVGNNGGWGVQTTGPFGPGFLTLAGCTVTANAQGGVYLGGDGEVSGSVIRNNGVGVETAWADPAGVIELTGNDLHGNTGLDLKNSGQAAVLANANFWGTSTTGHLSSGNVNPAAIESGLDNPAFGQVLIQRFLDSSTTSPNPVELPLSLPAVPGATRVLSGPLTASQTWTGIVVLTGDVTVPAGITVTVLPGTQVLSAARWDDGFSGADASGVELVVEGGSLLAAGTAEAPVVFTSGAAVPAAGDWHGLVVRHGTVTLRHVRQQFGGTGLGVLGGGDYVFEHLACNDNAGDGVRLSFQGSYEFTGLEASRNGRTGFLNDSPNTTVAVSQGIFRDNGGDGIYVAGNSILTDVLIERSQGSYGVFGGGGGSQSSHTWTDLTVSDSKAYGAFLSGFQSLTLVRGRFLRNGNAGLYAQVGGRVRAEESQFNSNGGTGLTGWQVSETEVIGGTARFNADTGLASTGGLKVTGATVGNNGGWGVRNEAGLPGFLTLAGCTVTANSQGGVYLAWDGLVSSSVIRNNGVGVETAWADPVGVIELTGNDLHGNTGLDLRNSNQAAALANGNFWGVTTTDELQRGIVNLTRILDRHDDPAWGVVTINQWRTGSIADVALTIASQPQSLTRNVGEEAVFSVSATGPGILSYRWRKGVTDLADGGRVSGAQTDRLTIASVVGADAGEYSVVVTSNGGDSTNSQTAQLTVVVPNQLPIVMLNSPAQGASFSAPATIVLTASASDPDDGVAKVEFFAGDTRLGEVTSPPYTFTWANVPAGAYSLTARATDHAGASATSGTIGVQVHADGGNTPPTISAIPDQQIEAGGFTGWIAFTVGDQETPADQLQVVARSSNTNAAPDEWISLSGTGANRFVLVRLVPEAVAPVEITLTVSDEAGQTVTETFTVRICPCPEPELAVDLYAVLTVRGTVGRRYQIEYFQAGPPENWEPLAVLTLEQETQLFIDVSSPRTTNRLYRAVPVNLP